MWMIRSLKPPNPEDNSLSAVGGWFFNVSAATLRIWSELENMKGRGRWGELGRKVL
jgi:hypothetical protein